MFFIHVFTNVLFIKCKHIYILALSTMLDNYAALCELRAPLITKLLSEKLSG